MTTVFSLLNLHSQIEAQSVDCDPGGPSNIISQTTVVDGKVVDDRIISYKLCPDGDIQYTVVRNGSLATDPDLEFNGNLQDFQYWARDYINSRTDNPIATPEPGDFAAVTGLALVGAAVWSKRRRRS